MNQLEKLKCENHEENLCPHEHGQGLGKSHNDTCSFPLTCFACWKLFNPSRFMPTPVETARFSTLARIRHLTERTGGAAFSKTELQYILDNTPNGLTTDMAREIQKLKAEVLGFKKATRADPAVDIRYKDRTGPLGMDELEDLSEILHHKTVQRLINGERSRQNLEKQLDHLQKEYDGLCQEISDCGEHTGP